MAVACAGLHQSMRSVLGGGERDREIVRTFHKKEGKPEMDAIKRNSERTI